MSQNIALLVSYTGYIKNFDISIYPSLGKFVCRVMSLMWFVSRDWTCGATKNAGAENMAPECVLSCLCLSRVKHLWNL